VIHIVSFLYCIREKAWEGREQHEEVTVIGLEFIWGRILWRGAVALKTTTDLNEVANPGFEFLKAGFLLRLCY
jgi:hypothetical protein